MLPPFEGINSHQLALFAEDSLVRISAQQAVALGYLANEVNSGGSFTASWLSNVPSGALSKTSLASCQATKDGIWEPSSGHWGNWGMGGPTECWTLSGSEWPSDGSACSLSDILEIEQVPSKYFLSRKAAQGILRRAEKRGKVLPAHLQQALIQVASTEGTLKAVTSSHKP